MRFEEDRFALSRGAMWQLAARYAAAGALLAASVMLAVVLVHRAAQHGAAGAYETTGSVSRTALPLSDSEREHIFRSVMGLPDAPALDPAPDVADRVDADAPLQELAASVTRAVPPLRGQKLLKLGDRILVVDPATRLVTAMIPRYKLLP